jgi:hypothetical protein
MKPRISSTTILRLVLSVVLSFVGLFLSDRSASAQVPLDHFLCYAIADPGPREDAFVLLVDQFDVRDGRVEEAIVTVARNFCNPVEKTHGIVVTPIVNIDAHLKAYVINTQTVQERRVVVSNQFGSAQELRVGQPRFLAVPTQKLPQPPPQGLDHFKCYDARGRSVGATVTLEDQFQVEKDISVLRPIKFCNPVQKTHLGIVTPILNPSAHLVCYDLAKEVDTDNQFGPESFLVRKKLGLCVPSEKLSVTP